MKKCNGFISYLPFPIDYSIISINRPTTNENTESCTERVVVDGVWTSLLLFSFFFGRFLGPEPDWVLQWQALKAGNVGPQSGCPGGAALEIT